jgi:hypothetical protein
MTRMEQAALQHAADELRYQRTAQAAIDAKADRVRRALADRAAGHLPACGLLRCAAGCKAQS